MNDMPHKNIDIIRRELMLARTRKTTFTSIEVLLITYTIFWLLVFTLTDNYNTVSSYAVLGKMFNSSRMIILLFTVSGTMILAGITKCKWLRCVSLILSTFLWLIVSSSIFMESLNTRSSTIVLAFFSAHQFINVLRGRRLL